MEQKQDLILQYLRPKSPATDDVPSITCYDVSKAAATTSGDEKSTAVGAEYKLKSSSSKKSKKSSSDTDEEDENTDSWL